MNQVIAVSKPGYNVLTETDPNNFIFHSLYNTFKIITSGTYSANLGVSATESSLDIAHSQDFTPFVLCFIKFENSRVGVPGDKASDVDFWFTRLRVDATNLHIGYINDTGGNYNPVFKYFLCEVPL